MAVYDIRADFLQALIDKPAMGAAGVVAHGDARIDWLYVEDVARAIVLASQTPKFSLQQGLRLNVNALRAKHGLSAI